MKLNNFQKLDMLIFVTVYYGIFIDKIFNINENKLAYIENTRFCTNPLWKEDEGETRFWLNNIREKEFAVKCGKLSRILYKV